MRLLKGYFAEKSSLKETKIQVIRKNFWIDFEAWIHSSINMVLYFFKTPVLIKK
jgi:hypothetical protein